MKSSQFLKVKDINCNILIGKNTFKRINSQIKSNNNISNIIIIDSKVFKKHFNYINKSINLKKNKIIIFNSLEKNKSISGYSNLIKKIFKFQRNRNTNLIIIGGGMLGDLGGFVASSVLRGLNLILIPTTLLSQVDSSIGGKNGINTKFGKNLIGTFYHPKLVIIDTYFLKSLPKRQIISGYAEIVKHSLIKNKNYFIWLEKNYKKILSLKEPFITHAIKKSIDIKSSFVKKDMLEKLNIRDSRAILNFGHTIGHALEAKNEYKNSLTHGEAISLGIICALKISNKLEFLNKKNELRIINHLKKSNLPTNIKQVKILNLQKYIMQDKKNLDKKLRFILLKDIGKAFILRNLPFNKLKNIL